MFDATGGIYRIRKYGVNRFRKIFVLCNQMLLHNRLSRNLLYKSTVLIRCALMAARGLREPRLGGDNSSANPY